MSSIDREFEKFKTDLLKEVREDITKQIDKEGFYKNCPNCKKQIRIKVGKNICPLCQFKFNAELGI